MKNFLQDLTRGRSFDIIEAIQKKDVTFLKTYYKIEDSQPRSLHVGGWLRDFLEKERDGMPGNLNKIGYPFDRECWRSRTLTDGGYEGWWPYEQTAYWVDSIVRLAAALGDEKVFDIVREQIDLSVIEDGDPFIGPKELNLPGSGARNRWPHAVYFRALWMAGLFTGDKKYWKRMCEHYAGDDSPYSFNRTVANAETMYRLAAEMNLPALKKRADYAVAALNDETSISSAASDRLTHIHGVTVNEDMKLGAVSYLYSGNREHLDAAIHVYEKLNSFHLLPDGVHTCYEATTGNESYKVHESCDLSDYTYSLSFLLKATGDGKYADRIEKAILNALPGATGTDFRTIQYFSSVNQVISARNSTTLYMWENTPRMAYQPHHYPECCVGNIGRAMPNYALNLYGDTARGLAVNFYSESSYEGKTIGIETKTEYPFEESVRMRITRAQGMKNVLSLRIPGWTNGFELTKNGKNCRGEVVNGYLSLHVSEGDELVLRFRYALNPEHSSDGGIYYTYGPFLMTLKLNEKWEIDTEEKRQTPDFPAYKVTTDDDFAYALSGYEGESAKITWKKPGNSPFWDGSYPIEIRIPAKRLNNWTYEIRKNSKELDMAGEGIDQKQVDCGATEVRGDLCLTPRMPTVEFVKANLGEDTEITLVPYGCTRLRLTVFPKFDFWA